MSEHFTDLLPAFDVRKELSGVHRRLEALEHHAKDLKSTTEVHSDRLDVHDMKFNSLEESLRELRGKVHQMQGDVFRIADAATSNALSFERQAKALYSQNKALESIAGNVQEVLKRLQPNVVLGDEEKSR